MKYFSLSSSLWTLVPTLHTINLPRASRYGIIQYSVFVKSPFLAHFLSFTTHFNPQVPNGHLSVVSGSDSGSDGDASMTSSTAIDVAVPANMNVIDTNRNIT